MSMNIDILRGILAVSEQAASVDHIELTTANRYTRSAYVYEAGEIVRRAGNDIDHSLREIIGRGATLTEAMGAAARRIDELIEDARSCLYEETDRVHLVIHRHLELTADDNGVRLALRAVVCKESKP